MTVDVGEEPNGDVVVELPGSGSNSDDVLILEAGGGHTLHGVRPIHTYVLVLSETRKKGEKTKKKI